MARSYFSVINHAAFMPHHAVVFGGEEFSKFERNAIQSADAENALQGSGKVHVTVANMLFCVVFIASLSFVEHRISLNSHL